MQILGSWVTSDNDTDKKIETRIGMTKGAFWKRKELMRRNLNIELKKRLLNSYVFSVSSYGCESWTFKKKALSYSVKKEF